MPEEEKTETVPMQTMPALALRGLTVYPKMMVHFDVGREASVKAIEESMSSNQPIFLVAQKDIRVEEPWGRFRWSVRFSACRGRPSG